MKPETAKAIAAFKQASRLLTELRDAMDRAGFEDAQAGSFWESGCRLHSVKSLLGSFWERWDRRRRGRGVFTGAPQHPGPDADPLGHET